MINPRSTIRRRLAVRRSSRCSRSSRVLGARLVDIQVVRADELQSVASTPKRCRRPASAAGRHRRRERHGRSPRRCIRYTASSSTVAHAIGDRDGERSDEGDRRGRQIGEISGPPGGRRDVALHRQRSTDDPKSNFAYLAKGMNVDDVQPGDKRCTSRGSTASRIPRAPIRTARSPATSSGSSAPTDRRRASRTAEDACLAGDERRSRPTRAAPTACGCRAARSCRSRRWTAARSG